MLCMSDRKENNREEKSIALHFFFFVYSTGRKSNYENDLVTVNRDVMFRMKGVGEKKTYVHVRIDLCTCSMRSQTCC